MNPLDKFAIDKYKEVLKKIEEKGKLEHLRELEDKIISEIIRLVHENTQEAKSQLQNLEDVLDDELDFKPRNFLLIAALRKSIKGALSAAKFCL